MLGAGGKRLTKPWSVSVHPDPRVQTVVEQGREARFFRDPMTLIRISASRPYRLDRRCLSHPAVIGGTFACRHDGDRVFFNADLAIPTVAEGDAAQVRQNRSLDRHSRAAGAIRHGIKPPLLLYRAHT